MNPTSRHRCSRGLSRIDCLVVTGCLGAVACLVLPGIFKEDRQVHRDRCHNNLKQLGLATINMATSARGVYPGYLQVKNLDPQLGAAGDRYPATEEIDMEMGWAAVLLPHLEQQALWDSIRSKSDFDWRNPPQLEVFNCPSDPQPDPRSLAMSYVANSGMPDIAGPLGDDPSDLKANGIFHDLRPNRNGPQLRSSGDIRDGSSTTLLFVENVHRDHIEFGHNWLAPSSTASNPEQWYGFTWVFDQNNPLEPSKELFEGFNRDTRSKKEVESPYSQFGSRFARPASNHPGVFVVIFAGGNSRSIHEDIDYRVYQQLVTPHGAKARSLAAPETDMKVFMARPLTDADF